MNTGSERSFAALMCRKKGEVAERRLLFPIPYGLEKEKKGVWFVVSEKLRFPKKGSPPSRKDGSHLSEGRRLQQKENDSDSTREKGNQPRKKGGGMCAGRQNKKHERSVVTVSRSASVSEVKRDFGSPGKGGIRRGGGQ